MKIVGMSGDAAGFNRSRPNIVNVPNRGRGVLIWLGGGRGIWPSERHREEPPAPAYSTHASNELVGHSDEVQLGNVGRQGIRASPQPSNSVAPPVYMEPLEEVVVAGRATEVVTAEGAQVGLTTVVGNEMADSSWSTGVRDEGDVKHGDGSSL
ncbi:hypothetical protein HDU93_001911, partial [Gonapodya sp. JEL0774]